MMEDQEKEEMMEGKEMEPSDAPVTEEYIEQAKDGVAGLFHEDFEMMDLKVPTQAKDGETVSVLLTGKAMGGRLTGIYGAEFSPQAPKKKKGRLTIMIRGGENQEEE